MPSLLFILTLLRTAVIFFAAVHTALAVSLSAGDVPLVRQANAWQPGEPIPHELLNYTASSGCMPMITDSAPVFGSITNYALLQKILFTPCKEAIFGLAVTESLSVVGPSRFYNDLRAKYAAHPKLLSQRRHRRLYAESGLAQVVVDSLYITDNDMASTERDAVFARITGKLQTGASFQAVLSKYQDQFTYPKVHTLADGRTVTMHLTHVGNAGDFLVSPHDQCAFGRATSLPSGHVSPLLKGSAGDILVLRDEDRRRTMLYRVREAYRPAR